MGKYEEALKREDMIKSARKLYRSGWWQSEQLDAVLEEMFPELKESEDERIRKGLMNEICCLRASESKGSDRYESLTKMLSYLEKQKDITPIVVSNEDWDCQRAYSEGYQKGMAESNKQNPEGWSEEDEKTRKTLLDYYEKALDNYTCVEWLNGITYGELCDWLKSLRPQSHWKPSEEQMAVLEIACKYEGVFTQWQLSMLLDLKEQLKKL